jgi:hypothetical protein
MSDRTISILGLAASTLGIVISVVALAYGQYAATGLVSLLVFEAIALFLWFWFLRRWFLKVYPKGYELIYHHMRYTYLSDTDIIYESIMVIRVTAPVLSELSRTCVWSGRGRIKIATVPDGIVLRHKYDPETGEITFSHPFGGTRHFGECVPVHTRFELSDTGHVAKTQLVKDVKEPTHFAVLEVFLNHRDDCDPAQLSVRHKSHESEFIEDQLIKEIDFDTRTRSFRVEIANPKLDHKYRLRWN